MARRGDDLTGEVLSGLATSTGVKVRPAPSVRTVEAASTVSNPVSVAWTRDLTAVSPSLQR